MQLTVAAWDDRVFPVELDANETLDTLKAILEAESGLPASQQQLVHHGKPLPAAAAGQTLSAAGVADGDVLMLLPLQPSGQQGRSGNQQQQQEHNPMMELAEDGSAKAPAAFIQAVKAQPRMMAALQQSNPALASAIRDEDISVMQVRFLAFTVVQQAVWLSSRFCIDLLYSAMQGQGKESQSSSLSTQSRFPALVLPSVTAALGAQQCKTERLWLVTLLHHLPGLAV
jgi:hypothetical protein